MKTGRWGQAVLGMALALVGNVAAAAAPDLEDRPFAVLQGLDKVTARVMKMTVPVGGTVHFGSLDITVRACKVAPPIEPPDTVAFLEISETKPGEPAASLFSGWMFAASPALSALEHPVYDVWLVDCSSERNTSSSSPS
ncbi:MAG: DUF2155 domain-containing protein [Azospirillaceae bacterium]|nr:DUF2155 domain-containing protein [Azospirillaceae bacterium]